MGMIAGQEPSALEGEPALGLEQGAWRTRPMAARIVPDTSDVPVGTGLDMPPEGRRPALHECVGSFADMPRERVGLLVGRKRLLHDRLERHEGHRFLRTRGIGPSSSCFFYSITPTIPATSG